jgi:ABC-2 type transport system permease protein
MGSIYVLWIRQLKKYWRSKPRMIGSLGQPLLFLIALGFGLGPVYQKAGAGSYIDFLVPGVITMSILFMAMFSGIELIWDRQFGFLKETLVAPVSRLGIFFGRTLGGATVALMQGVVVFVITLFIDYRPVNLAMLPVALVFMFLIGLLFTSLGTAIATFMEDMQAFPIVINFVTMPLFFLSGALFPLDGVPESLKLVAYFNPLSYGVDGVRGALSATVHFGMGIDFAVLVACCAALLGLGAYFFSRIQI